MNPFNTPIAPSHWKDEPKPAVDVLAHVRAAIHQQRQNWANQTGKPPIPKSRAGHGLEPWEAALIQEGVLSVAEVVVWTGRGADEIIEFAGVLGDPGDFEDMEMESE